MRRSLLVVVLLICSTGVWGQTSRPASRATSKPVIQIPTGTRILRDIEYARVAGKPLLLDVYMPPGARGAEPLVIAIHGGAWLAGSKTSEDIELAALRWEYVVAFIDYRLTGEARFPAQIYDCKAAVRFLRSHARDYGVDPDRIAAWGTSAGAHLAALLGTSGGIAGLEGDEGNPGVSSRVQAVVGYFGAYHFSTFTKRGPSAIKAMSQLLGGLPEDKPQMAKMASPVTYVTADDPPFLLIHGGADRTVPAEQSIEFDGVLREAGVESHLHIFPEAGHGVRAPEALVSVREFLDRHLKHNETP